MGSTESVQVVKNNGEGVDGKRSGGKNPLIVASIPTSSQSSLMLGCDPPSSFVNPKTDSSSSSSSLTGSKKSNLPRSVEHFSTQSDEDLDYEADSDSGDEADEGDSSPPNPTPSSNLASSSTATGSSRESRSISFGATHDAILFEEFGSYGSPNKLSYLNSSPVFSRAPSQPAPSDLSQPNIIVQPPPSQSSPAQPQGEGQGQGEGTIGISRESSSASSSSSSSPSTEASRPESPPSESTSEPSTPENTAVPAISALLVPEKRVDTKSEGDEDAVFEDSELEIIKIGWIAKQTIKKRIRNHSSWKSRLFILKRGCLFYHQDTPIAKFLIKNIEMESENKEVVPILLGPTGTTKVSGYQLILNITLRNGESSWTNSSLSYDWNTPAAVVPPPNTRSNPSNSNTAPVSSSSSSSSFSNLSSSSSTNLSSSISSLTSEEPENIVHLEFASLNSFKFFRWIKFIKVIQEKILQSQQQPTDNAQSSSSSSSSLSNSSKRLSYEAKESPLDDNSGFKRPTSRPRSVSSLSSSSSASSLRSPTKTQTTNPAPSHPIKRGWLYIKDNKRNRWEEVFMIASPRSFQIIKREEKGFFPLYKITLKWINREENKITVVNPTATRFLNLSFENRPELDAWLRCINSEAKRLTLSDPRINNLVKILEGGDRGTIEYYNAVRDIVYKELLAILQDTTPLGPPPPRKPFRILSLDGGGLRGIINAVLLDRIVDKYPTFLDQFDMISGCSNGGLIAAGLSMGLSASTMRALTEVFGLHVFGKGSSINSSKYSNEALRLLCVEMVGERKLKDVRKYLAIPSVLLDNQDPKERKSDIVCYSNADPNHQEESLCDVIMRTAAAPTYFPSWQRHVDGGLYAHDPSSEALRMAISPSKLNIPVQDVVLISFSTGKVNHFYDDPNHDWGYVQWVPKLSNLLWDCMIEKSILFCKEFLQERYFRMDPILPYEITLDDPAMIPLLVEIANKVDLDETYEWIEKHIFT